MVKRLGVSVIIYILAAYLSGLAGFMPLAHAAITDLTPPIIRHSPPERIIQGEGMVIMAIVEDEHDISWVNLWYRIPGKRQYRKLLMKQTAPRTYEAGLDVTKEFKKGIEYYIEAADQFGNDGTDGNKAMPYFVEIREIAGIPAASTRETKPREQITKRPWWKSPWFWVGVLAVAGGAVAAAGSGGDDSAGTGTIIVK